MGKTSSNNIILFIHYTFALSRTHTHTSSGALDHPIFPCRRPMICFIRVSCERKIPFSLPCKYFSCLLSRRYGIIKKFLSYEDDPLLSLLAVIRSGYPVFCKTTAKVFYIHSAIALFPRSRKKQRKHTRELSLSLTYESEKWQRNCRFKVTARLMLRQEKSENWFFQAKWNIWPRIKWVFVCFKKGKSKKDWKFLRN